MTHQERNTLVALICNLIVNGYVIFKVWGMFESGQLDGTDAPQIFARFIVWVVLAAIVLTIVLTILFNIAFAIATRETDGNMLTDERDRMFEGRSMGATMFVAAIGFMASFVALAIGWQPVTVFVMIYFSFALGSLFGDFVRLASYRAGG